MVNSGTVHNDLSSLKSDIEKYSSAISSLDGTWKGPSHDSITTQAEEFISEYSSAIEGEMNAFANACDSYEKYKTAKSNLASANAGYNQASRENDNAKMSRYNSDITTYTNQVNSLKNEINSYLTTASSVKLVANSTAGTIVSSTETTTTTTTTTTPTDLANNLILSSSGYVFPFEKGVETRVSSHVGPRKAPTAGASTFHRGTDISVPIGTKIHSLSDGVVVQAGRKNAFGYGNVVKIRQDDGNLVIYGHLSKSDYYSVGDRVSAGDLIALSGNEGISTGPHLHLQIENADTKKLMDSEKYFSDVWGSK